MITIKLPHENNEYLDCPKGDTGDWRLSIGLYLLGHLAYVSKQEEGRVVNHHYLTLWILSRQCT